MKTLKQFSFHDGCNSKYPWDKWADGQIWELTRGTDFKVTVAALRSIAYHAAIVRGLKYRSATAGDEPDKLVIQFYKNGEKK